MLFIYSFKSQNKKRKTKNLKKKQQQISSVSLYFIIQLLFYGYNIFEKMIYEKKKKKLRDFSFSILKLR